MSAPFLGDNEDEVDQSVFSSHNGDTPDRIFLSDQEAEPMTVVRKNAAELDGVEDHRTPEQKLLDFDEVTSEEDDAVKDKPQSSSGKKKLRCLDAQKKAKQPELADVLSMYSKEKNERAEKQDELSEKRYTRKFDLMEKTFELDCKKHNDNFQLQMEEMELRKRQMKLEEDKAVIRKLELQAMLNSQSRNKGTISYSFSFYRLGRN